MTDNNMSAARAARTAQALDQVRRFSDATETFRQRIARGVYSRAECEQVPRVTYNRRKWNRMDHRQQKEFERKMQETKAEYRLYYTDDPDAYTVCPKIVHDALPTIPQSRFKRCNYDH
jgi:CMP-N-acetylneuraminic acid synthetase